jgi:hypothetical protein
MTYSFKTTWRKRPGPGIQKIRALLKKYLGHTGWHEVATLHWFRCTLNGAVSNKKNLREFDVYIDESVCVASVQSADPFVLAVAKGFIKEVVREWGVVRTRKKLVISTSFTP